MQSHDEQMPIMEHLIELRNRLTWAVLALFLTFGLCYYFVHLCQSIVLCRLFRFNPGVFVAVLGICCTGSV